MVSRMLEDLFETIGVSYVKILHPKRETALETARAEGEDPEHVAKVVVVEARGVHLMFVVPANRRLDLFKAADACNDKNVRVVFETEMADDFPDSEVGAEPPFGSFYGLPVFLDITLTEHEDIVFNGGTHTASYKMNIEDYMNLATPQVGDYSVSKSRATSR